ncbi:hypothetical protein BASA83_001248 [Batrachochytrium salamandrivorans]|nr:hypothetical protein BASA83_001248 [Batrachochytrium salamandrivorans]
MAGPSDTFLFRSGSPTTSQSDVLLERSTASSAIGMSTLQHMGTQADTADAHLASVMGQTHNQQQNSERMSPAYSLPPQQRLLQKGARETVLFKLADIDKVPGKPAWKAIASKLGYEGHANARICSAEELYYVSASFEQYMFPSLTLSGSNASSGASFSPPTPKNSKSCIVPLATTVELPVIIPALGSTTLNVTGDPSLQISQSEQYAGTVFGKCHTCCSNAEF